MRPWEPRILKCLLDAGPWEPRILKCILDAGPWEPMIPKCILDTGPWGSWTLIFCHGTCLVTAFDFFFTDMSVATSHWHCLIDYFFSVFLGSKFQNCLRNSKIFLQLDAYASIIDSKATEIHKKHIFFYIKNINFGHIFDDLGDLPCRWQIGHFFMFSKVNFGFSQKIVA